MTERTKDLIKEGGKAFALPVGVMGGILTTENDVIRIFGVTLSNWLLIISLLTAVFQFVFMLLRERRRAKGGHKSEAN